MDTNETRIKFTKYSTDLNYKKQLQSKNILNSLHKTTNNVQI